jgi:hypothetical protein
MVLPEQSLFTVFFFTHNHHCGGLEKSPSQVRNLQVKLRSILGRVHPLQLGLAASQVIPNFRRDHLVPCHHAVNATYVSPGLPRETPRVANDTIIFMLK